GKIEKALFALRLQLSRQAAAEIALDLRPPERSEMIGRCRGAVGVPKQTAVFLKLFRIRKREKQLVVDAEREIAPRLDLFRQSRREEIFRLRKHCARKRYNRLLRGECSLCCFDLEPLTAVIDPMHRTIERASQIRPGSGDCRAIAFDHTPV